MARPVKTLREAAEDMVLASDDGTEYEHNDGCQGEPDCPACWVQGIRRLFDDFPDEGAPVANRERAALALVPVLLASGHDDEEVGSEAAELIDALTTAGVFRDEATVKAEALSTAIDFRGVYEAAASLQTAEDIATVIEEYADDLEPPTTVDWLELRDWFKGLLHEVAARAREIGGAS